MIHTLGTLAVGTLAGTGTPARDPFAACRQRTDAEDRAVRYATLRRAATDAREAVESDAATLAALGTLPEGDAVWLPADLDGSDGGDRAHVDYPHEAGRLIGCLACESRCHCRPDVGCRTTACVHCADLLTDAEVTDADHTPGTRAGCAGCLAACACADLRAVCVACRADGRTWEHAYAWALDNWGLHEVANAYAEWYVPNGDPCSDHGGHVPAFAASWQGSPWVTPDGWVRASWPADEPVAEGK